MLENLATAGEYSTGSCSTPWGLRGEFVLYFPKIIKTNLDLVKNPFVVPLENVADCMKDENISLRNDSGVKYMFKTNRICDFWLKVSDDYQNVGKEVLKQLLLFPCTYLCESGFSTRLHVKKSIEANSTLLQKTILNMLFHNATKNSRSC